jgi:integrase
MQTATRSRRARVERGIYVQPNGKYAVCCRRAGKLRFRTVEGDLDKARLERAALIAAAELGVEPVSPRLRFGTVAGWWPDRFEAKVLVGERHPRTLEAHRYQLEHNLLPVLGTRRVATLTVDDVAGLILWLRRGRALPRHRPRRLRPFTACSTMRAAIVG